MSDVVCVIPARYASTRLPGKPLLDLGGKPLIQWVYEKAEKCRNVSETWVATDDRRIFGAVRDFGGKAVMATGDFRSGTDRISHVVKDMDCRFVVNLQGDEPMMDPDTVDRAIEALASDSSYDVSTAMVRIHSEEEYLCPSAVKVVCDRNGRALYFSRSPIPSLSRADDRPEYEEFFGWKHLGLYVYTRKSIVDFPGLQPTFLEKLEQLEQLRFLENGYSIRVIETEHDSVGVDTRKDLDVLRNQLKQGK